MSNLLIRVFITWVLFIPVAIINGIIRNEVYIQYVGELIAHQISTVTACAAFIALAYMMLKDHIRGLSPIYLLRIGLAWVVMTMLFEFIFGHYVIGNTWEALLADYNILKGRVWGLFLFNVLLTPLIVKLIADWRSQCTDDACPVRKFFKHFQ